MQAALYKSIFCGKKMCLLDLSAQELAFENHRLVFFRNQMDLHFATSHCFFKCRVLNLLLNVMLASK